FGNYSFRPYLAALAPDPDPASFGNTALGRQLFADFDEELWLIHGIHMVVLGPEVEVLGQTIRRCHEREFRTVAQLCQISLENTCGWIATHIGVERIGNGTF